MATPPLAVAVQLPTMTGVLRGSWRSTRARARVVAAAVLVSAIGSSCVSRDLDADGASVPSTTFADTADGVEASLAHLLSSGAVDLNSWAASPEGARCVASRVVASVGAKRLLDLGFRPNSASLALPFAPDERSEVVNIMDGCLDMEQAVMDLLVSYAKLGLADSRCLAGEMVANGVTRTLIESMVSGAEPKADLETSTFARSLADAAATCLGDDDLPPEGILPLMPDSYPARIPARPTTSTSTSPATDPGGAPTVSSSTTAPAALPGIDPSSPLATVP